MRREDALFERWARKYGEKFIPDGVVNENVFSREKIRIVFVLKEVSDCGSGFDLRDFLANGAPGNGGHTWGPTTRWLGAVDGTVFQSSPDADIRKQWLQKTGAMNLKKTSGSTIAGQTKIIRFAKEDADLLKEQVWLYLEKPTLFPCCGNGVFELFRDQILKEEMCKENSTEEGIRYIKFASNGIAFAFRHPNAKEAGKPKLFAQTVKYLAKKFQLHYNKLCETINGADFHALRQPGGSR